MDLASPAPLLGHILPRRPAMAITYAQLEAIRFLAACIGVGAAIGLLRGIVVELRRP